MRNILSFFVFVLAVSTIITSCGEHEDVLYDHQNGLTLAQLESNKLTIPTPIAGAAKDIVVLSSTVSGSDRKITLSVVDSLTTATPDQYVLTGDKIAADSYTGIVTVTPQFDALPTEGEVKLTLALTGLEGANSFEKNVVEITMFKLCESTLAGTYIGNAVGTSTDGCCPGETSASRVVEIVEVATGEYEITDFTAGLYYAWYGIYGITADRLLPASFVDKCNTISGSFYEPFGQSGTIEGSVNADNGVITYNWISGWGDKSTVVLTRQ